MGCKEKAKWVKGWRADVHGTRQDPSVPEATAPASAAPEAVELPPHVEASWKFWRDTLGTPRRVLAPLLGQSDGPFRWLVRTHGQVDLCYTPMYEGILLLDGQFDIELAESTDRPCVCQIAGNDPAVMLEAALRVQATGNFDAIDLNMGCPQDCAKEGGYGVFLLSDLGLVETLVRTLSSQLSMPVFCKIRCREASIADTVHVALSLQAAGCSALTLHARLPAARDHQGPCNWQCIREVKRHLSIPLIANGSVQSAEQAELCQQITGADAVMSGTGLIRRPLLFTADTGCEKKAALSACSSYLDMCRQHGAPRANGRTPCKVIRDHLLAILQGPLQVDQGHNEDIWDALFWEETVSVSQFGAIVAVAAARIEGAAEPLKLSQVKDMWGEWEPWE